MFSTDAAVIDGTVRAVLETIVTAGVETVVTGKGQGQIDRKDEIPRHRNVVTLQHHATTTRHQDTAISHHGRENHPRSLLQNPRHSGDKKVRERERHTQTHTHTDKQTDRQMGQNQK